MRKRGEKMASEFKKFQVDITTKLTYDIVALNRAEAIQKAKDKANWEAKVEWACKKCVEVVDESPVEKESE